MTAQSSISLRIRMKWRERLNRFAPGTNSGQRYRDFISYSERLNGISERHFFYKPIGVSATCSI